MWLQVGIQEFRNRIYYILLKERGRKIEFARNVFPKGMRLASYSQLKVVEFHGNGDIMKSGTMAFLTSSGRNRNTVSISARKDDYL